MTITEFWKRLTKLGKKKKWRVTTGHGYWINGCVRCGKMCPLAAVATDLGFKVEDPCNTNYPELKLPRKFVDSIINAADDDVSTDTIIATRRKLLKCLGLEEPK